ncbi:MAG: diguanylate cyclase [Sediminispirochaetaceae bacterium]
MRARSTCMFLLVIGMGIMISLTTLVHPNESSRSYPSISLNEGWEYSWNAFPRDSSGSIIWDGKSINDLDWKSIAFPSNPPGRDEKSLVWYRITLPNIDFRDPALFIYSIDINAEFYMNAQRIHTFGRIDQDGRGKFIGWPVQLIELPAEAAGRELYVRVFSDYRDIGLWGKILLGNRARIISYMYRKDLFGLTVMIISLLIGIVFFMTYILSRRQKVSLYLSIITFLLAVRIFGQLYVQQQVIDAPILLEYIDAGTSVLLPLFITWVFRTFLTGIFEHLIVILIIFTIPAIPVHTIYAILDVGTLTGVAVLGYISFRCLGDGNREQKYISINFLIMAMLVLYAIMMSHSLVPWISEFDYLVVFQFSVGLAIILGYRFLTMYHTYENQSLELASMNRKLEEQVQERTSELEEANRRLGEVNVQLKREKNLLKVSSITDGLTGLYNRTYIDEQFRQFIKESSRYGKPFSVAMLDLDHFKRVNDEYGHHTGDEVLRQVAETFHNLVRETDIAGRYGGEEFLLLFPQTDHEEALVVTERIRSHIEKLEFEGGPERITISAGVAQYGGESAQELLNQADKNLYMAKQSGRNRIV